MQYSSTLVRVFLVATSLTCVPAFVPRPPSTTSGQRWDSATRYTDGATVTQAPPTTIATCSPERRAFRRTALEHLIESMMRLEAERANDPDSKDDQIGEQPEILLEASQLSEEDLPASVFDIDRVVDDSPLIKTDNAFFQSMNSDDTIRCPFVLNRPGNGIEAVVRFGKSTAGHPNTVHGGVTAMTFDNLLGTALFAKGAGPIFTAYLKVDYKAPLPCLTTAVVDVTIDETVGRKLYVTGRMTSTDGETLYATCEALFMRMRAKGSKKKSTTVEKVGNRELIG